jgi:hypothetical protein
MENFDDELIFDDEFLDDETPVQEPSNDNTHKEEPQEDIDLTSEILRIKGISNPDKIKFEDETGAVIERSWNNLTKEE